MTDERDTHERYRGGGREVRDRWNREDRYGASERRDDRTTTGDRHGPGGTDLTQVEATDRQSRPASGHGDTERGGGSRPPTGEPGYGRDPTEGRPASGPEGHPDPGVERSAERGSEGQKHLEITAGGGHSPGERRQTGETRRPDQRGQMDRRSDEQFGPDRELPVTGTEYRQPYGQPIGQQSDPETRHARFQQRRSTQEVQRRSRSDDRDAESGREGDATESSDGDEGREQPRDPETGQFLPKDEVEGDE